MRGSLMKPFQPVEVRGFSKYTRITTWQRVLHLVGELAQPARVVEPRLGIMDGARAHDDEQARVLAVQDVHQRAAAGEHGLGRALGQRHPRLDLRGGGHVVEADDIQVFGASGHGAAPFYEGQRPGIARNLDAFAFCPSRLLGLAGGGWVEG